MIKLATVLLYVAGAVGKEYNGTCSKEVSYWTLTFFLPIKTESPWIEIFLILRAIRLISYH